MLDGVKRKGPQPRAWGSAPSGASSRLCSLGAELPRGHTLPGIDLTMISIALQRDVPQYIAMP